MIKKDLAKIVSEKWIKTFRWATVKKLMLWKKEYLEEEVVKIKGC